MDFKLELIVIPVSDVDRAKLFYERLGWRPDGDFADGPDFRILQYTPPGSGASILFGRGVTDAAPGSIRDLYLVVKDIDAARAELVRRGVDVSEVFHDPGIFQRAGTKHRLPGADPARRSYQSFVSFQDPDGNRWFVQEVKQKAPGR